MAWNKSVQWGTLKINYNIEEKLFGERFLKSVDTRHAESHGNEHQPNTVYQNRLHCTVKKAGYLYK